MYLDHAKLLRSPLEIAQATVQRPSDTGLPTKNETFIRL